VNASAARSAVRTSGLADLVRKGTGRTEATGALSVRLATAGRILGGREGPGVVEELRAQVTKLRQARETFAVHIRGEFPACARLLDPQSAVNGPGETGPQAERAAGGDVCNRRTDVRMGRAEDWPRRIAGSSGR